VSIVNVLDSHSVITIHTRAINIKGKKGERERERERESEGGEKGKRHCDRVGK
jgi:hypothetical protein